jgi:hypothetical protein
MEKSFLRVGTFDAIDDRLTAQGQCCQIAATRFLLWLGKGATDKRINKTQQISHLIWGRLCPTSETVCFPVSISTYSHVKNSFFFFRQYFFDILISGHTNL